MGLNGGKEEDWRARARKRGDLAGVAERGRARFPCIFNLFLWMELAAQGIGGLLCRRCVFRAAAGGAAGVGLLPGRSAGADEEAEATRGQPGTCGDMRGHGR